MAVQLRRYEVIDGEMDALLAWLPSVLAVREQYGFSVEFVYVNRENNELTWAVSYPGDASDFEAAFDTFASSSERAAVMEGQPVRVAKAHLAMVDPVITAG